ncbi:enoyl-CoA hydratase-related protein [Nocardia sp. NPDC004068]|uniref:enoyl-CoA hydratase-related protein n=1 Tax=Nocardia sp. NPDC004068 TaxID=3364303 RepID=UPI003692427E
MSGPSGPVPHPGDPAAITSGAVPHPDDPAAITSGPAPHPDAPAETASGAVPHPDDPAATASGAVPHPDGPAAITSRAVPHPGDPAAITSGAVPHPVGLAEIASGAAALTLDAAGAPRHPLVVVDLGRNEWRHAEAAIEALRGRTVVTVGIADRPLPVAAAPLLEALTCTLAPGGPGGAWVAGSPVDLKAIAATVAAAPRAALTLAGLLDLTARASVTDGLTAESLAYSMLLAAPEFAAWRARTPRRPIPEPADPVLLDRTGDVLTLTLNVPERHNAFGRAVRDALLNGLAVAEHDPSIREVVLRGNGRSFCSGGDLDEFGTATDPVAAHLVRLRQSAAAAIHRLGDRVRVEVHGACIGAGVEIPSFAARIRARPDARFRLPELGMGLVPGAGGTVGITHRIGRWRTAYLALTGQPIDAATALEWGLIDELTDGEP